MARLGLLVAVALFAAAPASAQDGLVVQKCGYGPQSGMRPLRVAYKTCVLRETASLVRSEATPGDIAIAAAAGCDRELGAMNALARACAEVLDEPGFAQVPEEIERATRKDAISLVVRARAQ